MGPVHQLLEPPPLALDASRGPAGSRQAVAPGGKRFAVGHDLAELPRGPGQAGHRRAGLDRRWPADRGGPRGQGTGAGGDDLRRTPAVFLGPLAAPAQADGRLVLCRRSHRRRARARPGPDHHGAGGQPHGPEQVRVGGRPGRGRRPQDVLPCGPARDSGTRGTGRRDVHHGPGAVAHGVHGRGHVGPGDGRGIAGPEHGATEGRLVRELPPQALLAGWRDGDVRRAENRRRVVGPGGPGSDRRTRHGDADPGRACAGTRHPVHGRLDRRAIHAQARRPAQGAHAGGHRGLLRRTQEEPVPGDARRGVHAHLPGPGLVRDAGVAVGHAQVRRGVDVPERVRTRTLA